MGFRAWRLQCDDEAVSTTGSYGVESMLQSLKELQKRSPGLFPLPPKENTWPRNENYIDVFIADGSVEGIKKSAEAIRSHVDFPFLMYCFKKRDIKSNEKPLIYMHTVGGKLYEYGSPDRSHHCFYNLIGENTEVINMLPSQVTDRDFIHFPVNKESFKNVINEKGGKWILHFSDWKTLDSSWENLIRLYETGVLVGLKSRTSGSAIENSPDFETISIMCYTADADCKSSVRRAAEGIFICTGYKVIMYYKSNQASLDGKYRHEGFSKVSRYMFTCKREMYERDLLNRWKKISLHNEKH